ncbi:MAG: ornithine carbamoyltransferase [Methylocystaceae bacterium]
MLDLRPEFIGRDFICMHDYTTDELKYMLDVGLKLKAMQKAGQAHPILQGKSMAMIFQKSSTRTRVSFEVGMFQLGGHALFLSPRDIQMGRGETIRDTALTLSGYVDGIMIRTFDHDEVLELAEYAAVPVINALTDLLHPCQVMADLMTAIEYKGELAGRKLAFIGDGNNMAHSLMIGGAKLGMQVAIACPDAYQPDPEVVKLAKADAEANGGAIEIVNEPLAAARDADIVYTDVWASMGMEEEAEAREIAFAGYQVNSTLMKAARPDAIVMHCLPAKLDKEITAEVLYGPQSVVFPEAENRLHAQKAIMALIMR